MKTRILLIISSLILAWSISFGNERGILGNTPKGNDQITVLCNKDLQGLTSEWIQEYNQNNSKTLVVLSNTNLEKPLIQDEIAITTGKDIPDNASWRMTLGREAIVPVINRSNPYLGSLTASGISSDKFRSVFSRPDAVNWGTLIGPEAKEPVHLFILNNPKVLEAVQQYLGINSFGEKVILVDGIENFRQAVEKDPLALGFCNMTGVLGPGGKDFVSNIKLLPVDKNGNGKIDYVEDIYTDAETFTRGVWIGKYPKALVTEVYAVAIQQPQSQQQADFLSWILTGGQKSLASFGFTNLVYNEVQSKLDILDQINEKGSVASASVSGQKLAIFIAIVAVMVVLIIFALIGFRRNRPAVISEQPVYQHPSFDEKSILAPKGLFYDKSHTWAFMEKDGSVKVGIDDFMQHVTGPATRLEMRNKGEKVKKGEALLTLIQKGKKLVIYAPVSGTILEANSSLESDPTVLCLSPYSNGWVYRLEPSSWLQEIPLLSMAEKYMKWISDEYARLKDFMAMALQSHNLEYNALVLQDGGMLKNNLLEEFGPEIWEDFQSRFLDSR